MLRVGPVCIHILCILLQLHGKLKELISLRVLEGADVGVVWSNVVEETGKSTVKTPNVDGRPHIIVTRVSGAGECNASLVCSVGLQIAGSRFNTDPRCAMFFDCTPKGKYTLKQWLQTDKT